MSSMAVMSALLVGQADLVVRADFRGQVLSHKRPVPYGQAFRL